MKRGRRRSRRPLFTTLRTPARDAQGIITSMRILEVVDRWLPPPELLRLSGVGVDISESSIKYIGFEPNYIGVSELSLAHYGEVGLAPGVLSRGEINDTAALGKALAEVRSKTGVSYVRLSLPEERIYLFETEVDAGLAAEEIRQQIEFRLEENVPLSPRDAYFDFHVFDGQTADHTRVAAVTVCAREIIDKYYDACRIAKLTPLSFEVESAAIARAVLPKDDQATRLLVDFGKTRTGLGIVHRGVLLYTSTIELGGSDLSAALKRQLGDQPEAEWTKLKNDQGLARSGRGDGPAEVLLPVMSAIKDEIQLRIQYWNDKNGAERPIEQIIVCGGSANLRGLGAYLSETLGIDAVLADVWQNALDAKLWAPPIDRRHSYGYATSIGLALTTFTNKA